MTIPFEMEIWADKTKMKRALVIIGLIGVLAWVIHFFGIYFWDEYTFVGRTLRGTEGYFGWPVTLYWWGMFIGIIAPLCFVLIVVVMNKKAPLLALNSEGLFINQQLIRTTMVAWEDISRIELEIQGNVKILNIYFKDPVKIIAQQAPSKQTFLKENLKDGEPLRCDNRLKTGDFVAFGERVMTYLQ